MPISINIKDGTIKKAEYIVGIDLGTTNSLVAYVDQESKQPTILKSKVGKTLVPSILHFMSGISENHSTQQVMVGETAKHFLIDQPERTIYSVKRLLGKSYRDLANSAQTLSYQIIGGEDNELVRVKIDDRYHSPISLSAEILKELKAQAELGLKGEVKKAVITVPAYFNDSQRQATRDAGKLAGLEVLRIVNEPTAAALAYGLNSENEEPKHVAVYDLGGGTFDLSILLISNGIIDVLATHGDTYLGGDDIDRLIIDFWIQQHPILKAINQHEKQVLRLTAEEFKKALGQTEKISQKLLVQNQKIHLSLSQLELLEILNPVIQQTIQCCKMALTDSGLSAHEIEEVILVGGSTKTYGITQAVQSFFNKAKLLNYINPDEVVALGAAVEADILAGNNKNMLLLDVTPLSLGIETLGGLMDVMLPRNSKIPASVAKQYTTSTDGQVNLKINVYQGERELVSENRKLAEFELRGIPAMPAGLPKLQVKFTINADGILKVEAEELRSGVKQEVKVKPQYGLKDETVEAMLLDSLQNATSDVQTRMLVEAKNEGQQLTYLAERFLEKNQELLSDLEIQQTGLIINDLKNVLQSNNKDQILSLIDELNEFTKPFAERLMNSSIKNALTGKSIDHV